MLGMESLDDLLVGFVDVGGEGKQIEIFRRNDPCPDKFIEIDYAVTKLLVIEYDRHFFLKLSSLDEGEGFKQFVHGAETARGQ